MGKFSSSVTVNKGEKQKTECRKMKERGGGKL